MFTSVVLPVEGVWIKPLTEASTHPLDRFADGIRIRSDEAFRGVYDAMSNDLVSFAFGMVNDRRTAEDIVQEAFVELVRAAPKVKGEGRAIHAWLYRSVRFGCLDEYRRRKRRPEIPTEVVPDTHQASAEPEMLDPDLERALAGLSKKHRTLVLLRHVVGLSGKEIAAVMKMSRKAVYAALDRAEAKLRSLLDGDA